MQIKYFPDMYVLKRNPLVFLSNLSKSAFYVAAVVIEMYLVEKKLFFLLTNFSYSSTSNSVKSNILKYN